MADVILDTYKLERYAQRLDEVNRRISTLDRRLNGLYTQVGLRDLLKLIQADALTGFSWRLLRCQNYLNQTAADFTHLDRELARWDPTNFSIPQQAHAWFDNWWTPTTKQNQQDLRKWIVRGLVGFGVAESALYLLTSEGSKKFWSGELTASDSGAVWGYSSEDGSDYIQILRGEYNLGLTPSYGKYKDKSLLGDKDHLNLNIKQEQIPVLQINPDEKWYKEKGTILEATADAKVEGSVLAGQLDGENDWAQGSVSGKLLTGEAHANASAGFYVYEKDKDGNVKRVFSPGVSAEVGASVAVVEVDASGRIGLGEDKNMLGVYGDANAELLSAEAKAKVAFNKNEFYAGASAEADVVKVSGTAGVSVLGTDVGVSGSLKVGAGAHAEAGWTDGKLKVDVGFAVGVGLDLGFEVDVSGTVDAVCDFGESVIEDVSDFGKDIWKGVTGGFSKLF